ncbi:aminoglycoside phosphotransferase family protein [Chryseobacterium jejuense]|uniref:aminoglycoside phosphotransferase family protein n=1 Tax=Chryseobacterium jejuense TaxID=445960 RepID=UPI001AE38DD3|nr:aminoglycoside phosphotransferase family protein [Chryseobacterium jejuense]MBP2616236.1 aminoglycoside phosphotransferase (APT) family kinase protein [Chryseobacterium jejuense]
MHINELEISENLVQSLLDKQCSRWAKLPLSRVSSNGTVHTLYRLGKEFIIRLPRIEWVEGTVNDTIEKEFKWIPLLSKLVDVSLGEPVFKGEADENYPWSWTIATWNEGDNPDFEKENEYNVLAEDLADFLNSLHTIKLSGGPWSRRGVPLQAQDVDTRKAIAELKAEIDVRAVTELWNQLLETPQWNQDPLWVHGDLLPGNILIRDNRLTAIIDFSDLGIGDPACDLIIAWSLFNHSSRQVFRNYLQYIDEDTWKRGKGWALSIALIMLPYYKYSNPFMASLAERMIANILNDK